MWIGEILTRLGYVDPSDWMSRVLITFIALIVAAVLFKIASSRPPPSITVPPGGA